MAGSKGLSPSSDKFFPTIFVRNQFRTKAVYPPPETDLSSQAAIVTGSNVGLGLESCQQLLSLGLSRLIMAVRSVDKGETVAAKLRAQHPTSAIEVWPLDMTSYESIQGFVHQVDTNLSRLDFCILNAAVMKIKFNQVTSTGHEETVQVNYLSTVLLTILLLPLLKQKAQSSQPGRVTIVSAALTYVAKFANKNEQPLLPSFDTKTYFDMQDTYNVSKLLDHMFVYKLVDYLSADDVTVNLVCPGYVKGTSLARDIGFPLSLLAKLFAAVAARSIADGASTYVDAAVVKGKETHGCFLMSWQTAP